ncbi:MAG TPA: vWA domain-containing protein, partial [Steroidobacteraceae bacterium]|nr:vWA domain-containing protein [Steroidobacteraceae bacterium]
TLDRATLAAGGSLASRSGVLPAVSNSAQRMTFEVELVVVDGESRPIENLTRADFALRPCTPDAANNRIDCVRGPGADSDVAYTPVNPTPETLTLIPGQPAMPYAAALLLDQSGSILHSDLTGARLFSAKAFLQGMGTDDHALLAAFASGSGAIIPTVPLTVYGPFRDKAAAPSYFPTLDSLVPLVGGDTPLYESVDALRQQAVSDAALPAGLAKALVVFTDGTDTTCGGPETCRTRRGQSIQAAKADGVRLFTIGLSSGVDVVALGELANQTGGAMLYADSAQQLLPLYGSVGKLLSLNLPNYRLRWTVEAGVPGALQPGSTLIGQVQVTTATGTFA